MTDREKIEKEVKAANSLGFPADFKDELELPFKTKGAICFPKQAQFNPLKFIAETAKDLNIYENTFIRDITPKTAVSDSGKITAKKEGTSTITIKDKDGQILYNKTIKVFPK